MKWLSLGLATYVGLVTAHGDHAIPHVVGGRHILAELRARGVLGNHKNHARHAEATSQNTQRLNTRQNGGPNTDGPCGPGVGSCADGYCCSPAGWCGTGKWYCDAPDCQINYGTGCDGLKKPSGIDVTNYPRPHVGNVAYGGVGIYDCVTKGDIALTYDDGPYQYTGDLLDIFKRYGMVATFFVTGTNIGKGMINDRSLPWAGYIQRMVDEGHQVASHTWSHQNASQLNDAQYRQQINYNEIAIADIIGYFPTYMRPPYSICGKRCQSLLSELGYHIIYFDLDTEGYLHDKPELAQIGKDIWDKAVGPANPADRSFLHIEHDLQKQTVYNLTEYFLKSIQQNGFRTVPVGVCLGDDPANWYRKVTKDVPSVWPPAGVNLATAATPTATSSSSGSTPTNGLKISVDAQCGMAGITCQGSIFGNCCSAHGWCGNTPDHCGEGCQPAFGTCQNAVSSSLTSMLTSSSASTSTSATPSSIASPSTTSASSTGVSSTSTSSSSDSSTSTSALVSLDTASIIPTLTSAASTSSVSSSTLTGSTSSTGASVNTSSASPSSSSTMTGSATTPSASSSTTSSTPSSSSATTTGSTATTTITTTSASTSATSSTSLSSSSTISSISASTSTSASLLDAGTSGTSASTSSTTSSTLTSTSTSTSTSAITTSNTSSSSSSTRSSSATSTSSSSTISSSTTTSSTSSSSTGSPSTTLPNAFIIVSTSSSGPSLTTSSSSSILTATQATTPTSSSSTSSSLSSSSTRTSSSTSSSSTSRSISSSTSTSRSSSTSTTSTSRSSSSSTTSTSRTSTSTTSTSRTSTSTTSTSRSSSTSTTSTSRSSSTSSTSIRRTSTTTSTAPTPPPPPPPPGPAKPTSTALKVSIGGKCGKALGMTCSGTIKPCCNAKNECSYDCLAGCQRGYGMCLWPMADLQDILKNIGCQNSSRYVVRLGPFSCGTAYQ